MITGIGMIGTEETSIQIPTIPGIEQQPSITVEYNPVEKKSEFPYTQAAIALLMLGGLIYLTSRVEKTTTKLGYRDYR